MEDRSIGKYDRVYGGLQGVALFTKPSTVKNVQPLTGKTETFLVQTARHNELGDHIFIDCMNDSGVIRLALPPKVANVIASQRDSLSARRGVLPARLLRGAGWNAAKRRDLRGRKQAPEPDTPGYSKISDLRPK